jgi:hypothetical protein
MACPAEMVPLTRLTHIPIRQCGPGVVQISDRALVTVTDWPDAVPSAAE